MYKSSKKPNASSTAVKPKNGQSNGNKFTTSTNDTTFGSIFSNELSHCDLVGKSFPGVSKNKNNVQTDSMYSTLSGQSSLGILELENMSDIGNTYNRERFPVSFQNNQSTLQTRLNRASQSRLTLAKTNSIKSIFDGNEVNDENVRTSLTNVTNAFNELLKENMNNTNSSICSEDFISGNEFKENLAEIEKVNRKEFGSLSESCFNFSVEGEKQSLENGSFAANYFAAKSDPVKDLSLIFPKKRNINETFSKSLKRNECSLLTSGGVRDTKEEQTPKGFKTMTSITSWTDSHVSNNMHNITSLSDISDILTAEKNSANPKELTEALLSGDMSKDKQLNVPNIFPQRRLSTSTRFSYASQNLEHAELSFSTLGNFSFTTPQQKSASINENCLEQTKATKTLLDNDKIINSLNLSSTVNKSNSSFDFRKNTMMHKNDCHFILTPKSGYFEDCTSETTILNNTIDLSNFSILTNNYVSTDMSLNKSTNVSKIVYCNETLNQNKLDQYTQLDKYPQNYSNIGEVLDIGDICIGTFSQAVITLENRLTVDAKYTLVLLGVSLKNTENNMLVESKSIEKNIATVLCSDKTHIIPALSDATFTVGIIPLVSGRISVLIKLASDDISQIICRNIQINSIEPQISWVNNSFGSIDFGLLPELSRKSLPIKLLNKGTYQVPIKFVLNEDHCEDTVQAKAIIDPSELWQCDINILTLSLSKKNCKTMLITGRIQVVLDSVEDVSSNYSPLLYCSNLSGRVGFTSISFDQSPLILKRNGHNLLSGVVEVINNSELPVNLFVQQNNKQCSEFIVQPDNFQLPLNGQIKLKIGYLLSKSSYSSKEKSICLQVVSSQKHFFIKVNCIDSVSTEFQGNPLSSRPTSPCSTNSSSAIGSLELESTCSTLIWGSIPPNTKSIQTFTLRNRGSHKEKLYLSIKDNKNCFKMISSSENQVSEMKLLLEPMESQKLSVVLVSTSNEGPSYGQLVLKRQHSSEKRVISLFGYCGHSVVTIQGVFEDNFGHMWLYPNPQLMTAQFSVTNCGNTTAFVKINQENPLEDIILPNEFILKKGETKNVEVTIVMSPERLEMLIEQESTSKIININKITLMYGDEVSRVRVSRLWSKMKHEKKIVYPDSQRLDEVSNMFNGDNFINVDCLTDSKKSLFKLWKMGINENQIVLLMEKSSLESLLCDTTTIFNELETTVISRESE